MKSAPTPTAAQTTAAAKQIREALETLRGDIKTIDARIAEIEQEKQALRAAPLSLEDWSAYLKAHIERMGGDYGTVHMSSMLRLRPYETPQNEMGWSSFETEAGEMLFYAPDLDRLFAPAEMVKALCLMFPDELTRAFMERFQARYGDRWGNGDAVPVAERRAMIQRLDSELETLEGQRAGRASEVQEITRSVAG
ncbi:MAG: hypothetical protein Q8Q28_02475 [Pseudomonadota bacterium]|nr:hypothetical protein [Pseudomonadota bacterium]